jgi:hypothetical protein
MSVRIRFRRFYECDTEAERDLTWGDDSLIYCIDTDTYYKIYAGDYVEVPRDEIFFTSPIDINKIAISGVPDGTKFLRDDGSWAEGLGGGTGIKILYDSWDFKDPTAAADPSSGNFRLNTASYATVTELYISDVSKSTTDFSQILSLMGEGDVIYLQKKDDASIVARYKLTAAPTDNTGWWTLALEYVNSAGALFANNDEILILFSMAGAGGGHIIWDQDDNPMAQEPVLQFKRLNVTAETGKTVVTRPADTFIGLTPPSNPVVGDIWKNSETWKTYTRYDGYWVETYSDVGNADGFSRKAKLAFITVNYLNTR